jgi:Flp pilus assembly protein TadB
VNAFLMAAVIVVAFFSLQAVVHWTTARSAERRTRERYALLAKVAEQPRETADVVIALLREDDAKDDLRRRERRRIHRLGQLLGGLMIVAVGVGLGVFLWALVPDKPLWLIGLMLVLMGLVLFNFAYFAKPESPK